MQFNGAIDTALYKEMLYSTVSERLKNDYQGQRGLWKDHIEHIERLIMDAVRLLKDKKSIGIIGIGRGLDIPLAELANTFKRVILIDVDGRALTDARGSLIPELRSRVELRPMDVTGISFSYIQQAKLILEMANSPESAIEELSRLTRDTRVEGGLRIFEANESVDLLVSDMIVTQLAAIPVVHVERIFKERFSTDEPLQRDVWLDACSQMAFQMQQDHLDSLRDHGQLSVVISDVSRSPAGRPGNDSESAGSDLCLLGMHLADRLDQRFKILCEKRWSWICTVPEAKGNYELYSIEGVVIQNNSCY